MSPTITACTDDESTDTGVEQRHAAPSVTFTTPSNGTVTELGTIEVSARIADADAHGIRWSLNGAVLSESSETVSEGATVSESIALASGSNVVLVEVFDDSGAASSAERVIFLDAAPLPVLSLLSPAADVVVDASVLSVSGQIIAEEPPERVELFVDGVAQPLALRETQAEHFAFAVDVALAFGDTELRIEVEDSSGRIVSATRSVTRGEDLTAPVLSDVWPSDGHSVRSAVPVVWGQVSDNDNVASVEVEQAGTRTAATLFDDGRFSARLDIGRGASTFRVIATDDSGNEAAVEHTVWLGNRVAAGGSHSGWLSDDGSLFMWGRNNNGQVGVGYSSVLGDTDPVHPDVPTAVALDNPAVSLVAYQNTSVALDNTGALWGWGDNAYGRLGLGTASDEDDFDDVDRDSPQAIGGITDAVAIAGGYYHTLVLLDDGTVMSMGRNSDGQLGDGTRDNRDYAVLVAGLSDIVSVAAASSTSFALTADGALYSWGANDYAQLGLGTADDELHATPTLIEGLPPLAQVAAGKDHVLALDVDGTVWAWGLNASNQVGGLSHGLSASPIEAPSALDHLGTAVAVYANGNQSYFESSAGLVYGWGQNGSAGALGVTVDGDLPQPVGPVFGLDGVRDLGVGALHSVALRSDGKAFAWGWSFQGSLGAGDGVINAWGYRIPILVSTP